MEISKNSLYSFNIDGNQTLFEDDMHDFAIMTNVSTRLPILYPNHELAKRESNRLNSLGIQDLSTRPL